MAKRDKKKPVQSAPPFMSIGDVLATLLGAGVPSPSDQPPLPNGGIDVYACNQGHLRLVIHTPDGQFATCLSPKVGAELHARIGAALSKIEPRAPRPKRGKVV